VVLEPSGHLDAHTFEQLEGQITDLFASGRYKLIVDLSRVHYISSAGAGVFIGSLSEAQENDGNIILVNPTPNVEQVFDLLGLAQVFTIRGSVAEAMEFF
jgi:anti-sigma B factor antagonist